MLILSRGLVTTLKDSDNQDYYCISLDKLSDTERAILVEKHLISPVMAEKMPYRSLLVSDDASVAIMVNEEDHLRIQTMEAGLNLIEAFTMQNALMMLLMRSNHLHLMNLLAI